VDVVAVEGDGVVAVVVVGGVHVRVVPANQMNFHVKIVLRDVELN